MTAEHRDRYERWRVRHARGTACRGADALRQHGLLPSLLRSASDATAAPAPAPSTPASGAAFPSRVAGIIRLNLQSNPQGGTHHE